LFVECSTVADLTRAVDVCDEENVEWTVLGKGSNVLAADDGYAGAVFVLGNEFKRRTLDGSHVRAGAGSILAVLVQEAFARGMTGLEFAVGIPGTLGGALAMNAGARDAWIGSIVESVTLFVPGSGLVSFGGSEIRWDYRRTSLPRDGVIVEASLRLEPGDAQQIRRVMEANLRRRRRSQPLGMPSAGSVFVNPDGDSAGRLVEELGLKGFAIGGATVSDVHANFIVNSGGATAQDVVALIAHVRAAVEDEYGIELRPEVRFLGSFESA
jgi:UDP-N-acetylmuramate dehydrogenase